MGVGSKQACAIRFGCNELTCQVCPSVHYISLNHLGPLSLSLALLPLPDGQVPAVLFPKHTELGRADEFNVSCFEAIRLLSECHVVVT